MKNLLNKKVIVVETIGARLLISVGELTSINKHMISVVVEKTSGTNLSDMPVIPPNTIWFNTSATSFSQISEKT